MTAQRGTRRAQAAAETRELILAAAGKCFTANGYAGTTINDIAAASGVAVATVYTSVGGKPVLLEQLVRAGMEDAEVAVTLERVDQATGGEEVVRAVAAGTGATYLRHENVITLLLDTASHEPVAQRLLAESVRAYRSALVHAAQRLAQLDALAPGVDEKRAVDVLWYFFGIHAHTRLLRDATWSWDEAEAWLCATASRSLLRAT